MFFGKAGPQCLYSKPCFAICMNGQCKKQGVLCKEGYHNNQECALFHEGCQKIEWQDIEKVISNNPNLSQPVMQEALIEMDDMFAKVLEQVQHEHDKFKTWVKTYGHSLEVMRFVKNLTEKNYSQLTGSAIKGIVTELFSDRNVEAPSLIKTEIGIIKKDIILALEQVSDLYLKPGQQRLKLSVQYDKPTVLFNSRILQESNVISSFFDQKITSFKLLYRASENEFSTKQFHKKCDGVANTLTVVETEFGNVMGGFTPIPWSSAKKQWAADKTLKSFIFLYQTKEKLKLNLAQFAIANNPQKGPTFGCCDICIGDRANVDRSNAQFPISYNNGKYTRSPQSSFTLTGHLKGQFLTKQWQVFRVDFQ